MERQSSFGSVSSAGSAFTSRSSTAKAVTDAEKEQGIENGGQNLLTALFGALYTLAKEKINDTPTIAMLAIWIDFLMIFTLILMPEYPWKVDNDIWIYKVFYYIQIHLPIANAGYTFYLVIFYMLAAILFISVAICVWVGWCFMNDNFPFLWPIKVARVVVSVFVSMFYIASLNIFLMACACKKEDGVWTHLVFHLDCLGAPHIIHAAFSLTSGLVFFIVAFLLVLGDHELEPMSKSLLAAPHSMCELRALLCKTLITVADILFKPLPKLQVVGYCIACGLMFYYHARMVPHYVPWINVLRGGLNAVLAWVALMACVLSYTVEWHDDHGHPYWYDHEYRRVMTLVMIAGIPSTFVLGAAICWGHLVYAWRTALKFKRLPPGVKPRSIHRFMSEFDVEVASRVGRIWDEEGVLDPTALDLAENVLKAGVAMKPNSVFLHIAYSNFLIDVKKNNQLGWSHLEQAKKLEPNLSYQFSIFARNQEHKQKSAGGGGDNQGSVDLVSYVEFQKNYRALLVYHKASLVATREFWQLLTKDTIPLERLGHSFKRIDEMELMAEKTYRLVLDRYPTNAKLLKSYGQFLEHVKNDPWGAARYYAEAEKQEELAETQATELKLGDGDVFSGAVDENSAIITMNALSIIQTANKSACQILGYKRGELEGKNVSCLMPAPFSFRHAAYVRNYLTTGKVKVLDSVHEVVALHKDHYVFPLRLTVSRVSGTGQETMFMALLQPPPEPDPDTIKAWLLTTGTTLCVDQSFLDYAGWAPSELVGRAFSSLGADSSELDDLIASCAQYTEAQLKAGAVQTTTTIKHKYSDDVPVHITLEMGGTEDQRLLVVVMKKLQETAPMASFNHKGRCLYANTPLASMLGYKLSVLRTKDISQLLPQPYGTLHLKWIKDAESMVPKRNPSSCRLGVTSVMLSSNGTPIYVKTMVIPHNPKAASYGAGNFAGGSGETTWAVKVVRSSPAQLVNERRMQLLVAPDGTIKWANPGTPSVLFGLDPAALAGKKLDAIVDVFAEYTSSSLAGDVAAALAALLSRTSSKPGSSWRVGVGTSATAAAGDQQPSQHASLSGGAQGPGTKRLIVRQVSAKSRLKPAIMTVAMPTDDLIPEDVLSAAGADAAVVMELWRADMLLGVAEVVEGCNLVRVEPSCGMLLGVPHTSMFHTNLIQWLNMPAATQMDDLMGTTGAKRGGLKKSSRTAKLGPRLMATSLHADKRPVQIQLQACMKDGTHEDRLVLAMKVIQPLTGAPHMLASIIAGEAEGLSAAGWSGGVLDGLGGVSELVNLSTTGGLGGAISSTMNSAVGGTLGSTLGNTLGSAMLPGVPSLALDKVTEAGGVDLMGTNTFRGTHRSNADSIMMATARMVNIDLLDTTGAKTAKGRAPAVLVGSPTGGDEGQLSLAMDAKTPAGARAMVVSSGSEQESKDDSPEAHRMSGPGKQKKKHLTEEEREAMMSAKGARKAREWLDSGFGGFKQDKEEGDTTLPGAVEDLEGPIQLMHGRQSDDEGAQTPEGASGAEEGNAKDKAPGAGASEATGSTAGDGGMVSDYSRGKRLRKLTRLLSSKAATKVVTGFKFKVIFLAVGITLLHFASFSTIMGLVQKDASYLTEVSAAGEVLDVLHRTCTLALVLEAAQRGYGFTADDTAKYAAEMETAYTRFERLHQGLYLGFHGLRSLDTPELNDLWNVPDLTTTVFHSATDPALGTNQTISLFNLGALFTTAARDVQYAALNPDSRQAQGGLLSQNRQWQFLQANGPGAMHHAYMKSMDYMVIKSQRDIRMLQYAELVLLLLEGCLIIFLAVGLIMRLLNTISVHRQALFSVFLAIPHSFLRTLASRSVSIGVEDDAEEDEEDKALRAAESRKKKHAQDTQEAKAAVEAPAPAARSHKGDADGFSQASFAGKRQRRASFMLNGMEDEDATVAVNISKPGSSSKHWKGVSSTGGAMADRERLFNGKQLVTSAASAYQLAWPFALWGILVVILYGVSYQQFGELNNLLINIKMLQRTLVQTSRVTYLTTRIALEPDPVKRAAMQPPLLDESRQLDTVYFNALYGGPTMPDSVLDGSNDLSKGSLFANPEHKQFLFQLHGCLRNKQDTCLPETSPYFAVSNNGIDPMVQRLSKEAELLSYEQAADITPTGARFGFIWSVTWYDLHDGLSRLAWKYVDETKAAYNAQRTTHVVLLLVMVFAGTSFLVMMIRPFLKHISKESRRCAELLAQLPPDMDVEGMVAATWSVVKQERILAERSGKSFINSMYGQSGGGLTGLVSRIGSMISLRGAPTMPSNINAGLPSAGPLGNSRRLNDSIPGDLADRLFSPREQQLQPQALNSSIPGRGNKRGSNTGSVRANAEGGQRGSMQGAMGSWRPGRSNELLVAANSALFQPANSGSDGGGSPRGGGDLRRRNNAGAGPSRRGKSPSKRAIVPVDGDYE